ncbi:unnamed protein product [Vicia faba]|uniref:Uncharacterized protein n=1 Tax=Vicia faba TaxID=3906 RepID=A0AAV1B2J8_VICFA|nr:unnamed protein product [Vicia faba]
MGKTTVSLILALLVVPIFLDGYNAEAEERYNQQKKDDGIYKSQKLWNCIDCAILYSMCLATPYLWTVYHRFCPFNDHTNIAPYSSDAPLLESGPLP